MENNINIKLISVGAAGNKSAIAAIEAEVLSVNDVLLINSTAKDIPVEYRNNMRLLSEDSYGCAKESRTGEELMIKALDKDELNIRKFVGEPNEDTIVVINGSTDGGTGCGGVPVIADYVKNEIGCSVRVVPFVGFGIDETGLKNTVRFFTNLSEDYVIEPICNRKFLKDAKNNHRKAEELANIEFCTRLLQLTGRQIVESEQNIDKADLLKTIKRTGYSTIEFREFDRLKNIDEFNSMINNLLDETKSFDMTSHSQKRMAVILNIVNTEESAIDWNFEVLKERLGYVKEVYYHVQNTGKTDFITVISSGNLTPKEQIDKIYDEYIEMKNKISKDKEDFYSSNKYNLDDDDDEESVYESSRKSNSNSKFFNRKKFGGPGSNNNNTEETKEKNSLNKY